MSDKLNKIISKARMLPHVNNFFVGKDLPDGFNIPSSILIYFHDFDWGQPSGNSRYSLIIPFADMTYQIENHYCPVNCGQALLINPYLYRAVTSTYHNSPRLLISFELAGEQTYLSKSPLMTINESSWNLIDILLTNYNNDMIIPMMLSLTLLLDELAKHQLKTNIKKQSEIISNVLHYINQFPDQSFGIKDIANHVGCSESHLRRLFRKEMNTSLGCYLNNIRLNSAKCLLVETSLSIEAIGIQCGYDSIYSFSRFFKNSTGVSPMRFRKQHTKTN